MGIRKIHIQNEYIRNAFQIAENHCIAEIYKATGKVFHTEMSTLARWHQGGIQDPHLDTYSNDELHEGVTDPEKVDSGVEKPSREWTCIVYLNDNYTGGETYFPPSDYYPFGTQIENTVGSGLLFQGIYHGHGVFKVRRAPRHTIAVWFTEDIDKAQTQRPVNDLHFNELSIKNELQYRVDDVLWTSSDPSQDTEAYNLWKQQAKNL